jgi:hypothetical protein
MANFGRHTLSDGLRGQAFLPLTGKNLSAWAGSSYAGRSARHGKIHSGMHGKLVVCFWRDSLFELELAAGK